MGFGSVSFKRAAALALAAGLAAVTGARAEESAVSIGAGPVGAIPAPVNNGKAWEVYKDHWGPEDEAGYSAFVQGLGRDDCVSLAACLKSEANPYRSDVDPTIHGDCADMAYVLRGYYAWKNGLPFSYQKSMALVGPRGEDIRYSTKGNVVADRRQIRNSVANAPAFLSRIGREVSTAMFRTHPVTGGGRSHDDFYPVAISRETVRPGIIAYDIFGHVGLIYDILDDGRVLVFASHPDNTVSRTTYGPNFMRSAPALGAGLKAWRPIRVAGADRADDGSLVGGTLKATDNDALPGFSMEQYEGNVPADSEVWHEGEFHFQGRTLQYYDYVRRALAAPDFAYDPVTELRYGLQAICSEIKARKVAVDKAQTARLHLKPHPEKLPPNIYGTYGEWEEYSTPSRDARLKVSFIEMRRTLQHLVEDVEAGTPGVVYEGNDLAGDLARAFDEEKKACSFTYWRSDNTRMRLNLAHVMERLFELSFNPYMCPERRWGARGVEFSTCTDDETKSAWHNALRFLRYQAERTYDVRMDFALNELKPPMVAPPREGGLGVEAPADADIRAYIARLNGVVTASAEAPGRLVPVGYVEGE